MDPLIADTSIAQVAHPCLTQRVTISDDFNDIWKQSHKGYDA